MTKIDKSALTFGEPSRIVDKKYRALARFKICDRYFPKEKRFCASDYGVVLAHMTAGQAGGWGQKPDDTDSATFLCVGCHTEQEAHPGHEWWTQNVLRGFMRRRYLER